MNTRLCWAVVHTDHRLHLAYGLESTRLKQTRKDTRQRESKGSNKATKHVNVNVNHSILYHPCQRHVTLKQPVKSKSPVCHLLSLSSFFLGVFSFRPRSSGYYCVKCFGDWYNAPSSVNHRFHNGPASAFCSSPATWVGIIRIFTTFLFKDELYVACDNRADRKVSRSQSRRPLSIAILCFLHKMIKLLVHKKAHVSSDISAGVALDNLQPQNRGST